MFADELVLHKNNNYYLMKTEQNLLGLHFLLLLRLDKEFFVPLERNLKNENI